LKINLNPLALVIVKGDWRKTQIKYRGVFIMIKNVKGMALKEDAVIFDKMFITMNKVAEGAESGAVRGDFWAVGDGDIKENDRFRLLLDDGYECEAHCLKITKHRSVLINCSFEAGCE
jgi:hypothetical protein